MEDILAKNKENMYYTIRKKGREMRLFISLLVIFSVFCGACYSFAMNLSGTTYTITSKTLTYIPEKARVFLKENVRIVNEAFTVTAQEVDIVLEEQKESLSFSSDSVKELLFRRNVTFVYKRENQNGPIAGKSDSARYDVKKEMLYMYGNVVVETDGNIIEGDEVAVNLITNTVHVQGTNKKPVEVLLRPRKE